MSSPESSLARFDLKQSAMSWARDSPATCGVTAETTNSHQEVSRQSPSLTENVLVGPEERRGGERLLLEDIKDRPREVSVIQSIDNVFLSDNVTSANIDKSHLVTTSQNFSET